MSSELKECRYNKNHRVKVGRLFIHESNCPDKKNSDLVRCSYDVNHLVKKSNLESHLKICPKKPNIDQQLHQEMLEYVLKHGTKNKPTSTNSKTVNQTISNSIEKNSNNNNNYSNAHKKFIAGLGLIEDKKEKKRQQMEYRKLMNNSSNFCGMSQIGQNEEFDYVDIDTDLKDEFKEDSIFSDERDRDFVLIENPISEIHEADDSTNEFFGHDQNNNKLLFHSSKLDDDEYDPNSSDIFIGKQNKNHINESEFVYYH